MAWDDPKQTAVDPNNPAANEQFPASEYNAMVTDQKARVPNSLFDAYSMLYADVNDTPAALAIAASRIVGRKATGGIAAMTAAEALAILNVADGADVTGSNPPQAHGASAHTDRTRHLWMATPYYFTGGAEMFGIALDPSSDEFCYYTFAVPNDFDSIGNIYVYYAADVGSGDVVLDVAVAYGAAGESQTTHSESDNTNIITISDTNRQRFQTVGFAASAAIGDIVLIGVKRDANHASDTNTDDLVINGVLIEYTADM